jgi:hypothetical protein
VSSEIVPAALSRLAHAQGSLFAEGRIDLSRQDRRGMRSACPRGATREELEADDAVDEPALTLLEVSDTRVVDSFRHVPEVR